MHGRRLTVADRAEIKRLHDSGVSKIDIAVAIGCSLTTIKRVMRQWDVLRVGEGL